MPDGNQRGGARARGVVGAAGAAAGIWRVYRQVMTVFGPDHPVGPVVAALVYYAGIRCDLGVKRLRMLGDQFLAAVAVSAGVAYAVVLPLGAALAVQYALLGVLVAVAVLAYRWREWVARRRVPVGWPAAHQLAERGTVARLGQELTVIVDNLCAAHHELGLVLAGLPQPDDAQPPTWQGRRPAPPPGRHPAQNRRHHHHQLPGPAWSTH